jgi:hypothetical protein
VCETTISWAVLLGLGAFHGLNPGMGWLFAVALGMQERRRGAVLAALLPLGLGHAVAVGVAGVGYSLHGLWDLLHELQAHGAYSALEPGQLTAIPLAYGIFCAAFELCVAAYFFTRRLSR